MIPETFPRHTYFCLLDEQPDFLVPPATLAPYVGLEHSPNLVVNPYCWFGWHGPLPASMAGAARWHENIYDFTWTVWVYDAERCMLWPYWLGPGNAQHLANLVPGQPYDGTMAAQLVAQLVVADILIEANATEHRRSAWLAIVREQVALFERGWLQLSGLLPPFHLAALRRYYRYHTRIGTFRRGDDQSPGRYVAHEEPVTRYIHNQLARTISDLAGRVVVPSYSYLALYQGGASLDPHVDREECEYTVSLCVDATPNPDTHGAWLLHLMSADGQVSLTQSIGDALLFRGRTLTHWRDRLADGYTSSSVLFHFVDG